MDGDPTAMNIAICKALGLDPNKILRGGVTITLTGALGPIVEVRYRSSTVETACSELKRYRLVPVTQSDELEAELQRR